MSLNRIFRQSGHVRADSHDAKLYRRGTYYPQNLVPWTPCLYFLDRRLRRTPRYPTGHVDRDSRTGSLAGNTDQWLLGRCAGPSSHSSRRGGHLLRGRYRPGVHNQQGFRSGRSVRHRSRSGKPQYDCAVIQCRAGELTLLFHCLEPGVELTASGSSGNSWLAGCCPAAFDHFRYHDQLLGE